MKKFFLFLTVSAIFLFAGCKTTNHTTKSIPKTTTSITIKTTSEIKTVQSTTKTISSVNTIDFSSVEIEAYTSNKSNQFVEVTDLVNFTKDKLYGNEITINDEKKYENYYGVGAALTGASAYLIKNSPKEDEIIDYLFGSDGLNIQVVRLCIGSSDFPNPKWGGHYTYDDIQTGTKDLELKNFSIAKDDDVIAVLQKALAINPDIRFIAAPWSAPAWMKDSQKLDGGGNLSPFYNEVFAKYLIKFVEEYAKYGINIDYLSIQNEPLYQNPNSGYPTMYIGVRQAKTIITDYLGPMLEEKNLDTKILIYDHNAGELYPFTMLSDDNLRKYVKGVGLHCYVVETAEEIHTTVKDLKTKYPEIEVLMTECTAGTWYTNFDDNLKYSLDRMYTKVFEAGASGTMYWNMVLDPKGETHLGGCAGCTGVISVEGDNYNIEAEALAIGHYGKYVDLDATRIDVEIKAMNVMANAYMNNENEYVLVLYNSGKAATEIVIKWRGANAKVKIPAKSMMTVIWRINK